MEPPLVAARLAGFLEFFHGAIFSTPHSTKQIEDAVGWGLETDAQTILRDEDEGADAAETRALCEQIRCPVLVVQGTDDQIVLRERGAAVAAAIPGHSSPCSRAPRTGCMRVTRFDSTCCCASSRGHLTPATHAWRRGASAHARRAWT